MINIKNVKKFCNEDISLIENYNLAINDYEQTWDCHHRKEIDEGLSRKQLKELGLYYGRPADELILLTHSEHSKLHYQGEKNPMYGKHLSEDVKQKISKAMQGKNKGKHLSEEAKQHMSEAQKGEKNGMYGKHLSEEAKQKLSELMKGKPSNIRGKHRVWNDENDHSKGYHFEK